ncbi:unnamed protein product [Musa acuminata subsp. malaccensis]|uniref:(wild Malaysian banana) hypothetical protein n=1 Tax=Musa acuminata subsp. malaccensis TaxID=214687 RepID=A0A804JJN7_MUSAM|nr:PREDICTED: uncharacterized protein LOC103988731 [Musa acuminata subsp. malaccensis]CAG1847258.1 unnamed protein product [Musa acuminata subsp. malaccensis]
MQLVPEKFRNLWNAEEIRVVILASLLLQIFLISLSLLRKRHRNMLLSFLLWISYLGADYVAILALGNLLSEQTEASDANRNGQLRAFWAPFLLLHLGGPDTITSYSLEDNELWLRHLLGLVLEVVVAILVFLESLPSPHLWKAAIVVFAAGILKYVERTWALWSASMDRLRQSMFTDPDPGPNYVRFKQEYRSRERAGLQPKIEILKERPSLLPQGEVTEIRQEHIILWGYRFFRTSKRLVVDLMLSFQDRIDSQNFFLQRTAKEAFQVVEVELSFLHDILHTKATHVHTVGGRVRRVFSLTMAAVALVLFHLSGKHGFNEADVMITYVLLVAALGLEAVAIVVLLVSDWTIVALQERNKFERPYITCLSELLDKLAGAIVKFRGRISKNCESWWSNSTRHYSLIRICLRRPIHKQIQRIMESLRLKELWDIWQYVEHDEISDDLKELIFQQLKDKASCAEGETTSYKRMQACRGEWILREMGYPELEWSVKKEFDESILLWHIATYLCYQTDPTAVKVTEEVNRHSRKKQLIKWLRHCIVPCLRCRTQQASGTGASKANPDHREPSKRISEYMMYLVVFEPFMLPAGIGKIRFQDTCAEAMKFFNDKKSDIEEAERVLNREHLTKAEASPNPTPSIEQGASATPPRDQRKRRHLSPTREKAASGALLKVQTTFKPIEVKGDRSKSVLFDACTLAKEIIGDDTKEKKSKGHLELEEAWKKKWTIINGVWVEMLCFAAGKCNQYFHAKQLSQGGELLTHVWLLMIHMGIARQYRIETGHARALLLVDE